MTILTNKHRKEICNRVFANYLIAKDALIKADLPVADFTDAIDHLTENTIRIMTLAGCEPGEIYKTYSL